MEVSAIENKKAQAGLGLAGKIIMALLILAVLATTVNIALANIKTAGEGALPTETTVVNMDYISNVTELLGSTNYTNDEYVSCTVSVSECYNATGAGGAVIGSGNYTASTDNCKILHTGKDPIYNGTAWYCNYTASYKDAEIRKMIGNVTEGQSDFFSDIGTWMTILGVVVLLLIIAIIIMVVRRFGGGSSGGVASDVGGTSMSSRDEGLI